MGFFKTKNLKYRKLHLSQNNEDWHEKNWSGVGWFVCLFRCFGFLEMYKYI